MYSKTVKHEQGTFHLYLASAQNRRENEEDKEKFELKFSHSDPISHPDKKIFLVSSLIALISTIVYLRFYIKNYPIETVENLAITILLGIATLISLTLIACLFIGIAYSLIAPLFTDDESKGFQNKVFDLYIPKGITAYFHRINSEVIYNYFINSIAIEEKEHKLQDLEILLKRADSIAENKNDLCLRKDLKKKIQVQEKELREMKELNDSIVDKEFAKIKDFADQDREVKDKSLKDAKRKEIEEKLLEELAS